MPPENSFSAGARHKCRRRRSVPAVVENVVGTAESAFAPVVIRVATPRPSHPAQNGFGQTVSSSTDTRSHSESMISKLFGLPSVTTKST